jgi:hypothetical protein
MYHPADWKFTKINSEKACMLPKTPDTTGLALQTHLARVITNID